MNCDICENKFDETNYKPYVLYPCSHTFCIHCLNVWKEKTCPNCRLVIQDKNPNWMLMKLIAEIDKISIPNKPHQPNPSEVKPTLKSEKISSSSLIFECKPLDRPPLIDEPLLKPVTASNQTDLANQTGQMSPPTNDEVILKPVKVDPKSAEVHKNDGLAFIAAKKFEDAIASLDKSIKINHNDYVVQNSKGFALNQLGKYEEAIECFDKAIKIYANYAFAYNNKAIALSALRRYEEALQCFDKVIEINPDDHKGLYNKGMALFKLHRYDEAISYFRKSIAIYPNDKQTQIQLDKCISSKKKEIASKQVTNAFSLI